MISLPKCQNLSREQLADCRRQQAQQLQEQWLITLGWGSSAISRSEARRIQLWLGIFPVHWQQLPSALLLQRQVETLQRQLGGEFGGLLSAMLLDPALQLSLNGPANQKERPNENLARELLELFSLGEGNYTETDVINTARALTGYRLDADQQLVLNPRHHDSGLKTILGRTQSFESPDLAQWLSQQPATARNIVVRLWQRMIGPLPQRTRLKTLAEAWRQQKLSIPWLINTLQQSPEAQVSRHQGLRLSDPLEVIARSLRLLGSQHPEAIAISLRGLRAMGQAPFEPPSVKGWPTNSQWLQLRWLQARRRTLQQLLANEEVWASRQLPPELSRALTGIQPLTINLPASATRENLALLFTDPVWQLA
ncbi:MAG: DUF1800 family protein [Cyanobium sp.]